MRHYIDAPGRLLGDKIRKHLVCDTQGRVLGKHLRQIPSVFALRLGIISKRKNEDRGGASPDPRISAHSHLLLAGLSRQIRAGTFLPDRACLASTQNRTPIVFSIRASGRYLGWRAIASGSGLSPPARRKARPSSRTCSALSGPRPGVLVQRPAPPTLRGNWTPRVGGTRRS